MSKALDIANNLSEFDGLAPAIDLSNVTATNITGTNVTPTNLNIASTHHTFTVKGIDETVGTDTQSGQFSIYNGATKLWGINEDGWTQSPNRPSFCGYKSNGNNYLAFTRLEWTITHNIGDHFDGMTFTVPVDGLYQFNYGGITHDVTNYFYIGFAINGSYTTQPAKSSWRHLPQTEAEYHFLQTSITTYLYVGDYVEAYTGYNGGTPYLEGARSNFSGFLIG